MKDLSLGERQVVEATKSALLAHSSNPQDFQDIQSKFSDLLKNNFENRNIWLRFGLTISLAKCSPQSALQAYNECMRIDQDDPLPAMLAAKLLLEDLDEPERALEIVNESIERCKRLMAPSDEGASGFGDDGGGGPIGNPKSGGATTNGNLPPASTKAKSTEDVGNHKNSLTISGNFMQSSASSKSFISPNSQQLTDKVQQQQHHHQKAATTTILPSCRYKDINPLLSKSYLLASIMHAQIYERELESIKQFKVDNLKESLRLLGKAIEINPHDHLAYFHTALHQVKQRETYPKAIDNLRQAIKISPHHIRSMQLLILTLSALKLNDEALILCESTLHEHGDNLLLLYFKCNLEQRLVGTKGYKTALCTAQYMLKCMLKRSNDIRDSNNNSNSNSNKNSSSATTISMTNQPVQQNQQQQPQTQHAQNQQNSLNHQHSQLNQQNQLQHSANSQHQSQSQNNLMNTLGNSTNIHNTAAGPATLTVTVSPSTTPVLSKQTGDAKQMNNLFANDSIEPPRHTGGDMLTSELSVWLLVAEIFVKIGSIEDAEMCVDEASIYASGALSHRIMFVRGLIAKARSNLIEAKTFFQSCLALCPRHAMALQQVAHVHYLLGNYSTAEKFLKDSLDLDSDCFKTWHYLSLVLIELSQHERASECAKKSTLLEESSPVVPFSAIPRLTLQ